MNGKVLLKSRKQSYSDDTAVPVSLIKIVRGDPHNYETILRRDQSFWLIRRSFCRGCDRPEPVKLANRNTQATQCHRGRSDQNFLKINSPPVTAIPLLRKNSSVKAKN